MSRYLALAAAVSLISPTWAQHKCVDAAGRTTYQQSPCASLSSTQPTQSPRERHADIESAKAASEARRKAIVADLEAQLVKKEAEAAKRASARAAQPAEAPAVASTSKRMDFDNCQVLQNQAIASAGFLHYRPVLATPAMRVVRICTKDGSVLLTCNKPDQSMVTTTSEHRC